MKYGKVTIFGTLLVALLSASSSVQAQDAPPGSAGLSAPAAQPTPGPTVVTMSPDAQTDTTVVTEEAPADEELGHTRVLNGHPFIQSTFTILPLVTTYVASSTGFGLLKQDVVIDLGSGASKETLSLAVIDEQFNFGIAFTDWIGIEILTVGNVAVGVDNTSALIGGALFVGTLGGRVAARIFEIDEFYLSARLGGSYAAGEVVSPLRFVGEALNTGAINSDTLLVDESIWQIQPSIGAAFAPIPAFGLQTSLQLGAGTQTVEGSLGAKDSSEFSGDFRWGLAASFDGKTLFAPVAFQLGYELSKSISDSADPSHTIEGGVYYSGFSHLNLGLAAGTTLGNGDSSLIFGQLKLAHYW